MASGERYLRVLSNDCEKLALPFSVLSWDLGVIIYANNIQTELLHKWKIIT